MGDIARILSYESFEASPLPVKFTSAINNRKVILERSLKEYLALPSFLSRCFSFGGLLPLLLYGFIM